MAVEFVKAAKEHRCDWCGGSIDKGTMYAAVSVSSGTRHGWFTRYKAHRGCNTAMRRVDYEFTKFENNFEDVPRVAKTIIVRRSSSLCGTGSDGALINLFICRVETEEREHPAREAYEQCLRHDLRLWEEGERAIFRHKPRLDDYQQVLATSGFPEITRPE